MAWFDLPLEQLETYQAPDKAPRDFDTFWKYTLAETAAFPLDPHFVQVTDDAYQGVDVYDVTFRGYLGQPIKGWFLEPAGNETPLPCLVTYVGYGGGRGLPVDHLAPAVAGLAHLVMDTRGQGSGWSPGDTPDIEGPADDAMPRGGHYPGFMTRGILHPETYYYRRVYVDAVRAVEAALAHPHVDPARLAVTGGSQGGGISIAAAALAAGKVRLCMPDVPYLCHFRRSITLIDTMPYNEIALYLKTHRGRSATVFKTLSYFDGLHFAPRIKARCLFSVGLMDTICPPSAVYATYHRVKAKKEMRVYDFNNHEGGGSFQVLERLHAAKAYL